MKAKLMAAVWFAAAIWAAGFAAEAPPAPVREAIEALASADFDAREAAARKLIALGESCRAALDALRAAQGTDGEVRERAGRVLGALDQAAIVAERAANRKAYDEQYAKFKEGLQRDHKDKWVVIAGGKLLADAPEKAAAPGVFDTLEAADAAANKAAPGAHQRYVFKVGDDGDRGYSLGACEKRFMLGTAFLDLVSPIEIRYGLPVVSLRCKRGSADFVEVGVEVPNDGRGFMRPTLMAPLAPLKDGREETFCVSSGFDGPGVVTGEFAARIKLERWEVPGRFKLKGLRQGGECSMAYVQLYIKQVNDTWTTPVLIWANEAQ